MQQQQQVQTAKEVFTTQSMVEITGCICENEWRHFKPGVHNTIVGRAVGFTSSGHLLVSYKPGFMSCETTSWVVLPVTPTPLSIILPKIGGPNPDRYNYDGPGSKIHS